MNRIGVTGLLLLAFLGFKKEEHSKASAKFSKTERNTSLSTKRILVNNPGDFKDIRSNLLAAYEISNDGDTLVLPAGTFSITTKVIFTKMVSLKGAGMGKTVLYRPNSIPDADLKAVPMINYNIWKDISSGIFISGISFKGKAPSLKAGDGKSRARDFGLMLNGVFDFVVTRCRFENFGEAGLFVKHRDYLAGGLVYNCEFYHNMKGKDGLGTGYGICVRGEGKTWVADPKFGSSNFIFIEDNTFGFHRHSIASSHCALFVARYNKIRDNLISFAIDMHGPPANGERSARASEIYQNTIANPMNVTNLFAIRIRGGESLIYNNVITGGFKYAIGLVCEDSRPDLVTYPKYTQIGYLSAINLGTSPYDGDVVTWNNKLNNTVIDISKIDNSSPATLQSGRDYHLIPNSAIQVSGGYILNSTILNKLVPNGYKPYTYPHPKRIF